jgi:plasmid stabilization system protein ParE
MTSRFVSSAEEEFADAGSFYESERLNLGDEFIEAIQTAVNLLEEIPEMGSPIDSSFRSVLIRRFPYRIIYKIADSEIVIIAVAHQSRHPEYWRDRM